MIDIKIKASKDTVSALRWLCTQMHQKDAIRADLVVEGYTILRWHRRNFMKLINGKPCTLRFDPGEAISVQKYLDRIAATDPLSLAITIDLVNEISAKLNPHYNH
jgi:hypothetical protein